MLGFFQENGSPPISMAQTSLTYEARVRRLLEGLLVGEDYELAYLVFISGPKRPSLQIALEKKDGTPPTIDICARFHRQFRLHLLQEELFKETSALEVSSPGLDRPLFTYKDFKRFEGRHVRLTLKKAHDGQKRFEGRLESTDQETICVHSDNQSLSIMFANIHHCKLIPIL